MKRSYGKVLFKQSPHRGQLCHPQGRQQAKPLNLILEIQRAQCWRAELFYNNNQNISPYSTLVSIGLCYGLRELWQLHKIKLLGLYKIPWRQATKKNQEILKRVYSCLLVHES